jgi:hypothetical protein
MGGVGEAQEPTGQEAGWRHVPALAKPAFPRTTWGHRGYEEAAVDAFTRDATVRLHAADAEVDELRSEIDRLHRYIRRQWATIAAAGEADGARHDPVADANSPAAQARAVLAHANEIAQRHIAAANRRGEEVDRQAEGKLAAADAEAARRVAAAEAAGAARIGRAEELAGQRLASADAMAEEVLAEAGRRAANRLRRATEEARRVVVEARERYEDQVTRAHNRADQAAAVAVHGYEEQADGDADAEAATLLAVRATYLQAFARVSRDALGDVLAPAMREFDALLAQVGAEEAQDEHLPATPVTGLPMEAGRPAVRRAPGSRSPVIALYPDMHPGRRPSATPPEESADGDEALRASS